MWLWFTSVCLCIAKVFAAPENVVQTKMDVNNLSTVMAPSCLRSRHASPETLLENTQHEMSFVRTLIENLDTTDMEGIMWLSVHCNSRGIFVDSRDVLDIQYPVPVGWISCHFFNIQFCLRELRDFRSLIFYLFNTTSWRKHVGKNCK